MVQPSLMKKGTKAEDQHTTRNLTLKTHVVDRSYPDFSTVHGRQKGSHVFSLWDSKFLNNVDQIQWSSSDHPIPVKRQTVCDPSAPWSTQFTKFKVAEWDSIYRAWEAEEKTQKKSDCTNLSPQSKNHRWQEREHRWGAWILYNSVKRMYLHAQVLWHCAWLVDFGHPKISHALESLVPLTLFGQSPSSQLPTSQLYPAINQPWRHHPISLEQRHC